MAKYYYSPAKQKALLLLASGIILGLSRSPKVHWRILKNIPKAWREIDRKTLRRIVQELKYDRLVDFKEEPDGTISVVLNEKGKKIRLNYDLENMTIKQPSRWDRKWRIVVFDIPEKKKAAREALRKKLLDLEFYQLQRSVLVHPYECKSEIAFISEFFEIRSNLRYIAAEHIDNEAELKLHFGLN
ncbi:hypothetical protein A2757_00790 [Candidatus Giovannonibacteria bacterium RIFCSPHIGHO2_01_FULL_48_47]|nr:MAG: hypothetical protein A2757_00790 [Candidatus Giovannonibacteria bacterium RIFCSPHIGHO2_01_FULL_48_47]OGF67911.1 MAG: hypothetical protein A3D61_02335 [Candidatus Giovannonibacteria bacterium RIFCSPHIGHO2_02_FULL_48_15]OGF88907.1 MAG: hypothetical protein A3B26_01330 [Candidatus Giovannonibacteria bacterium RIFCSPLOWO2_01_FULL_48_47]OGF94498.1 MAG: hypothetical protein A2433_01285 [Candidatus Giovannonibacteria bacterium RIFOXYC1_FULL_48_8]OGF96036.1 MAG: hypothetical protein A2613_00485